MIDVINAAGRPVLAIDAVRPARRQRPAARPCGARDGHGHVRVPEIGQLMYRGRLAASNEVIDIGIPADAIAAFARAFACWASDVGALLPGARCALGQLRALLVVAGSLARRAPRCWQPPRRERARVHHARRCRRSCRCSRARAEIMTESLPDDRRDPALTTVGDRPPLAGRGAVVCGLGSGSRGTRALVACVVQRARALAGWQTGSAARKGTTPASVPAPPRHAAPG
jgi:hypothetical protein